MTHAISFAVVVAGWGLSASALIRADKYGIRLGYVVAVFTGGALAFAALISTIAVALWGRRPRTVLAIGALTIAGAAAMVGLMFLRP
ncbi:MAG: hypothetical protein ABI175_22585 [Polyangiales bacterium]